MIQFCLVAIPFTRENHNRSLSFQQHLLIFWHAVWKKYCLSQRNAIFLGSGSKILLCHRIGELQTICGWFYSAIFRTVIDRIISESWSKSWPFKEHALARLTGENEVHEEKDCIGICWSLSDKVETREASFGGTTWLGASLWMSL